MALNTWINPLNKVSLTGLVDITANSISLIGYNEDGEEGITHLLDLFVMYKNISSVEDVQVPIGGGQYYTIKAWVGTTDDLHVPGLESLIEYLQTNYRAIDDDSILNNYYTVNKTYQQNTHMHNDYNYLKTTHQNIKNLKETTLKTDEFTYNKKNIINNITIKKVPIYLNIEYNFYYIKK